MPARSTIGARLSITAAHAAGSARQMCYCFSFVQLLLDVPFFEGIPFAGLQNDWCPGLVGLCLQAFPGLYILDSSVSTNNKALIFLKVTSPKLNRRSGSGRMAAHVKAIAADADNRGAARATGRCYGPALIQSRLAREHVDLFAIRSRLSLRAHAVIAFLGSRHNPHVNSRRILRLGASGKRQ